MHLVVPLLLSLGLASAAEPLGDNLYYFGDLHVHTGFSLDAGSDDVGDCHDDTCGAFTEVYADARTNGLDFVALTDHLNGFRAMSTSDWETYRTSVLAGDDPDNGFVTILGGELWQYAAEGPLGHTTLLMWEDNARLTPLTLEEARHGVNEHVGSCDEVGAWADELSTAYGSLSLIPHHPATYDPIGTDWSCFLAEYSPAAEVYSRHGNSLEGESGWDVPGAGVVSSGYVATALDPDQYGLSFGFVGGTDAHDTRPGETCQLDGMVVEHLYGGGLTAVMLDASTSFDRLAIRDAVLDHRTYATSGPRVPLELSWSVGEELLGGLGAALEVPENRDLHVDVQVPSSDVTYVDEVRLIGPHQDWVLLFDGVDTWSGDVASADLPEWLYVRVELDGAAYYSADGCDDGGDDTTEFLWSSPSFITLGEPTADPDKPNPKNPSVCGSTTSPTVLLLLIGAGLAHNRRRQRP